MNAIDPSLYPVLAALAGLFVGVLLGRLGGRGARRRIEELEVSVAEREARIEQLDAARRELEEHRQELGLRLISAEQERDERREQLSQYQAQVVTHFSQTSDLLKEMTLQYRSIYQHLAEGAENLCPDGVPRLEPDTPIDGLPDAAPRQEAGEGADDDEESCAAAHRDPPVQVDPRPEL